MLYLDLSCASISKMYPKETASIYDLLFWLHRNALLLDNGENLYMDLLWACSYYLFFLLLFSILILLSDMLGSFWLNAGCCNYFGALYGPE